VADIYTVTERVRAALGLPGDALPDLDDMIGLHADDCIQRTVEMCAADASLRHLVWTDPADVTVTLDGDGAADLSGLVDDPRILLNLLKYGEIRHASYSYPFRLLENSGQGAFAGSLDSLFPKCWLVGSKLYTRINGESPLSGDLTLAVPYWLTLAQLPEELVGKPRVGLVASLVRVLPLEKPGKDEDKQGKRGR
jgi:hypothetical protein